MLDHKSQQIRKKNTKEEGRNVYREKRHPKLFHVEIQRINIGLERSKKFRIFKQRAIFRVWNLQTDREFIFIQFII